MSKQMPFRNSRLRIIQISHIKKLAYLSYKFTQSNIFTFVVPNTIFGIASSFYPPFVVESFPNSCDPFAYAFSVLFFNWSNLLIFDLANQRLPESVREDAINKPWRPLPSKMTTSEQTTTAMLILIPAVLLTNHYLCGTGVESSLIQLLVWLYNDLGGGDKLSRDPIIAVAFGLFNYGSLRIASGGLTPSSAGQSWIICISLLVLTTMQVQDLKDQPGDMSRGRQTIPLVFGDKASRRSLAVFVPFWSCFYPLYWGLGYGALISMASLGLYIAYRAVRMSTVEQDANTWKLWCVWISTLYLMPLLALLGI